MIILPTAEIGKFYSHSLKGTLTGALPRGLTFSEGVIKGVATESCTKVLNLNGEEALISSIRKLELSSARTQAEFVQQLQAEVSKRKVWSVGVPSLTSQTLLELIGTVGAYMDAKIEKARVDSFQETAVSLRSKRAIALMKGIRLNRKLPQSCVVKLASDKDVVLPAFSQLGSGSIDLFNPSPIRVKAGVPTTTRLYAGAVKSLTTRGLGTPYQSLVLPEADFVVSDAHVQLEVDGVVWPRTLNGIWHLRNKLGFDDITMVDGRVKVQFGTSVFGGSPSKGAVVQATYAVAVTGKLGPSVHAPYGVSGVVVSGLEGGLAEKPLAAYRYLDSFGSFGSALTKAQIHTTVLSYPGIVDANVEREGESISVVYLPDHEWSSKDTAAFTDHIKDVVAFKNINITKAEPLDVDCELDVEGDYDADQVRKVLHELFAIRLGAIGRTVFDTDVIAAVKSVEGVVTLAGASTRKAERHQYLRLSDAKI